jgi:two-component system chemotaxis response regulator CheB
VIRALLVEDSCLAADSLHAVLAADPAIEVVGVAESGEAALAMLGTRAVDVVLMDAHLPGIDGYETTRRIMQTTPVPIIVCTANASCDSVHTMMRAMEAGALAAASKPLGPSTPASEADAVALVALVKLMSEVRVVRRRTSRAVSAPIERPREGRDSAEIVAIGASTGGPPVLARILSQLPPSYPVPIVIVQHMSEGFTPGFVDWLNSASSFPVRIARQGAVPQPGHAYVAPAGHHLVVGARGTLETIESEPSYGLRPSVGVLFRSVAEQYGARAIGILLTGMGRDGAAELKLLADRGALTIAQSEESCVVFGMPGEAVRLGAARLVLTPDEIGTLLCRVRVGALPSVGAAI